MMYKKEIIEMNKDGTVDIPDGGIVISMIDKPKSIMMPDGEYKRNEEYWNKDNWSYNIVVLVPIK